MWTINMEMELLHRNVGVKEVSVIRLKIRPATFQVIVLEILLATAWQLNGQLLTQQDVQKEIATYEAVSQQAKTPDMPRLQAGRIWWRLGTLYQDAGMYGKSEQALEHPMRLLAVAPVSKPDLAMAIDSLGMLYMQTGNVNEAERAESKALKMREEAGLTSEFPKSWYHLATLYLREHQPAKAKSFAERAVNGFLQDPSAVPEDKLGSQLVLASALCQSHQYAEAIEKLQSTVQMAKETYGPDTLPIGFSSFLLGYAYWKSGDPSSAGGLMQHGAEVMGKALGWEHPGYLLVMTRYAQFLRKQHRQDAARPIEQQVKRVQAQLSANPAYGHGLQTMDVSALF
jgi:tetratricopeptide (TPR) repeat protein